jgi:urease accessory protein
MRARQVLPAGTWDAAREADRVELDYDHRHRRRIVLHTERGGELMLDLPHAVHLHEDDGLLLNDGRIVRVSARAEPLMEIRAEPALLLRIAWHLGNRHLPAQLCGTHLRIRSDAVIADMVRQLGGQVSPVEAPFDPETGAYAGHHHAHDG